MANTTSNLTLTLPGLGEYTDSWHTPMNDNFTRIDTWAGDVKKEIADARFTKSSLKLFLEVAHETDGNLKPTPEVIAARNSFLYTPVSTDSLMTDPGDYLGPLALRRDTDLWRGYAASSNLRDAMAYRHSFGKNMILAGMKDVNGYPTWCGFTGATVHVDGSATPIILMIDGQISRIRTLKDVVISGGAGTKYIYATYQTDGVATFSSTSGVVGVDKRTHQDTGKSFPDEDVEVDDILRYTTGPNLGDYLISVIAPGGAASQLKIRNYFPSDTGGSYEIRDPLAVTLGFDTAETPALGKFYIAEVEFDGSSVTEVRARHFSDTFIGEWRAVDVSGGSTTFEEIWSHHLGTDKITVEVQASTANDGSAAVETLDTIKLANTLAASNGTLAAAIGTLAASSTASANSTPPDAHVHTVSTSLSGTPSLTGAVALTGDVTPYSSVAVKYNRNQVWVKNVVPSAFFRDYSDVNRQVGFVRVIITKKG